MQVFDLRSSAKTFEGSITKVVENPNTLTVSIDVSAGFRVVLASEEVEFLRDIFVKKDYDEYH